MFKLSHKKSQLTRKYGNTILTILTAFSCLYACKRSSSTTKNVLEEQDVSLLKEMFADTANILVSDFIINLKKKHNADCTSLLDPTPENKTDPLNNPLDESCAEVLELKRLALESHKVTYNRWLAADFYLKYLLMQRPANIVSLATEVFKGAYTPKYQEMVTVEKHERHPGESEAEVSFSLQKVPLYCAHITECTNMLHYIANFSAVIPEQVLKVLMQIQKSIPIALKDQNMAVVLLDQRVRLLIQLALKNHLLFDSKENITKITAGSLPNITEQEYQALEKIKKNLEEIAEEASTSFTLLTSIGSSEDRSHLPSFEHLPGELRIIAKAILPTMLNSELTRLSDGELRALNVDEHVLKDPENIKFQDLPTDAQDFLISTISIMLNDHLITYETALSESIYLQRLSKISNPQKVYDLREWGDALLQKISKNEISTELALNILIEHDGYEVTLPSRRQWLEYLNRVYKLLQIRFNQHKTKLLSYYGISNQEYFCREPYQKTTPDIREFCTTKAKLEGEQLALEKFINKIQNSHKEFENAIAKNLNELTGDTSGNSIVEKELVLIQKLLRQSNLFSNKKLIQSLFSLTTMPYTNLALYTAYSSTDIEKEKEQRHGLSRERRELIAITEASQALIACIAKKTTSQPNDILLESLDLQGGFIGNTQSIVTGENIDLKLLCNKITGEYGINTLDARILANFKSDQITKEGKERTFRDFSIAIGAINMLFAAKITNVAFTKLLQKALKNPTLRTSFTTIATKTGKAAPWLGFGGQLLGVSVLFHIFSTALTDITTIGYDLVTNGSYDEKNPYKKDFTEAFFHRYFNTEGIMHGFVVMGLLGGLHKINHAILQSKSIANISSTLSKITTSGGKDAYKLYLMSKKHSTTISKIASGAVLGTFFSALPAAEKQIQELLGNSLAEVPLYKDKREKVMSIASAFASGFIFAGLNHFLNGTSGSRTIQSMGQANMSSMSYRKALETLGIDLRKTPNPTMAQIKKAYKSANQKLHPDKNREATQKELDAIMEKFHAVKEAYNRVK